jgi:PBSX family phage portal protein
VAADDQAPADRGGGKGTARTYPLKGETRKVKAVAFFGRKDSGKEAPAKGSSSVEKASGDATGESAQQPTTVDVWGSLEAKGKVIAPPYDLLFLASLNEGSSDLGHMVEAMVTNVVGYGWALNEVPNLHEKGTEPDPDTVEKIEIEWENFDAFLSHGNFEPKSLTELRRAQRTDLESTGCSFLEFVPDGTGQIMGFAHAPSHRMRLTPLDAEATLYEETIPVGRGHRRRLEKRLKRRKFRRFVQIDPVSNQLTYFKEFDDPRPISRATGEILAGADADNPRLRANPVLYRLIYAPRTPYGIPRWIGALLSILGTRSAQEVNYTTLANNQIPSMALLISNGQLTDESVDRIEEFTSEVVGSEENWSKFLLIEAEPDGAGEGGQVKIEMIPMREAQHEDGMFSKYTGENLENVRRSFRMPPIISGSSTDYTRSTSDTSRRLAEEQTFEPARREEDWDWNRVLYSMGMRFHQFRSNSPNVTNVGDMIAAMGAAEKSGAMTPRIAMKLLEDILGMRLPAMDEEQVAMDVPFSLSMAEAVKNLAQPNEPGQQVTALKSIEDLLAIRDKLIDEYTRREKVLARGGVPGIMVETKAADRILAGIDKRVTLATKCDPSGPVVLCDDLHALGWVELSDPEETADGWSYRIDDYSPISPQKHGIEAAVGAYIDSVEMG